MFYELKLFELNKNFQSLIDYDSLYTKSFSKNEWCSSSLRVELITRSKASAEDMYQALKTLNLFNPFQLTLFSIVDGFELTKENVVHSILRNNSIMLTIKYLPGPSLKIKFANSTLELLKSEEFNTFCNSLSQKEIDSFFEKEYLENSLNMNNIYSDFRIDILGIKNIERWLEENSNTSVGSFYKNRLSQVNISGNLINSYYDRLKNNLRNIENYIRENKGFNEVGSLYREELLFQIISENYPELTILSQYSPDWLGRQRIDIYIKELNLAIEYNGRQHYEPISIFGGKEGLIETRKRDILKRKRCEGNDCELIELKYDVDLYSILDEIKTRTSH